MQASSRRDGFISDRQSLSQFGGVAGAAIQRQDWQIARPANRPALAGEIGGQLPAMLQTV